MVVRWTNPRMSNNKVLWLTRPRSPSHSANFLLRKRISFGHVVWLCPDVARGWKEWGHCFVVLLHHGRPFGIIKKKWSKYGPVRVRAEDCTNQIQRSKTLDKSH